MVVRKRELSILQYFLNDHSEGSIKQFQNMFNVSDRSIRYDIDSLNYFLKDMGLMIRRDNKSKISLPLSEQEKNNITARLKNLNTSNLYLSDQEKIYYVICTLLNADNPVTIATLADQLALSRTSLNNIMKEVYSWFKEYEIQVTRKTNMGIQLQYTENQWRRAAIQLLNNEAYRDYFYNILYRSCTNSKKEFLNPINYIFPNFGKMLLEETELSKLIDIISNTERALNTKFTDSGFIGLLIHFSIVIKRIRQGKKFEVPQEKLSRLQLQNEYLVSKGIAKILEETFDVKIPPQEIDYITLHLQGTKRRINNNQPDQDLKKTVLKVIVAVEEQLQVIVNPVYVNELANDLVTHLSPALIRLKNGLKINNPIMDTIITDYNKIFLATKKSCEIIKEKYQLSDFPDEEAAYVTMHIGAVLEKSGLVKKKKIRAIIMCHDGIGTEKMLTSRLQVEFPDIEVIGKTSFMDLWNIDFSDTDIIVSTLDVDAFNNIPVIKVSPFLNSKDIQKIENVLKIKWMLLDDNFIEKSIVELNDFIEVIKKSGTITNESELRQDLYDLLVKKNKDGLPRLSDLIPKERIAIFESASGWEEAVREAGKLLVNTGCVKESYIDAMVNTVNELGAYIVLTDGIAMPHARPEDGVLTIGMSLVILKNPVHFGNREYDPVNAIFALAVVDKYSHLQALTDMIKFALVKERLDELISCNSPEDVYRCLLFTCKGENQTSEKEVYYAV